MLTVGLGVFTDRVTRSSAGETDRSRLLAQEWTADKLEKSIKPLRSSVASNSPLLNVTKGSFHCWLPQEWSQVNKLDGEPQAKTDHLSAKNTTSELYSFLEHNGECLDSP